MTHLPEVTPLHRDVALYCRDEADREIAFISTLSYDAADPYAVWLTFHLPTGDLRWAMSRQLLLEGLTSPCGEGDLRLAPGLDEDGLAMVVMTFCSPEGRLVAKARTRDLMEFLRDTLVVVPHGTEDQRIDHDAMVEALLTPQAR